MTEPKLLRAKHVKLRKKYTGEEYLLRRKVIAQQKVLFTLRAKIRNLKSRLRAEGLA